MKPRVGCGRRDRRALDECGGPENEDFFVVGRSSTELVDDVGRDVDAGLVVAVGARTLRALRCCVHVLVAILHDAVAVHHDRSPNAIETCRADGLTDREKGASTSVDDEEGSSRFTRIEAGAPHGTYALCGCRRRRSSQGGVVGARYCCSESVEPGVMSAVRRSSAVVAARSCPHDTDLLDAVANGIADDRDDRVRFGPVEKVEAAATEGEFAAGGPVGGRRRGAPEA